MDKKPMFPKSRNQVLALHDLMCTRFEPFMTQTSEKSLQLNGKAMDFPIYSVMYCIYDSISKCGISLVNHILTIIRF